MKIGAQLYTLRDFAKTPADLAETLKKVADIGYTVVQLSGVCAYDAEWMKEQLAQNGLTCALTHTNHDRIAEDTEAVIAEHRIIGSPVVGLGMAPHLSEPDFDYGAFVARYLPAALKIRDAGLLFAYHNHNDEFMTIDGITIMEKLAADFPVDAMTFTLDTYWIQAGGADPAQWIRKFAGRAHNVHLKDMTIAHGREQRMAYVGGGNMNFPAILEACKDAGTEYVLVEQDDCYVENPFECMAKSYEYLKAQGLK